MVCLDISELCWTEPAFPDVTLSSSSSSLRDLSTILPQPFPDSSSIWSSITTHDLDPTPSSSLDSVQSSMRYQVSPTASFLYPYYQTYDAFSSLFRSFADDEQVDISPVVRSASLNDVDRWFWPEAASEREVSIINSYSFTSVESSSSLSSLSDHSDVILDIPDEITESDESASTPTSPSLSYTDLFYQDQELSQSTSVTPLCHSDSFEHFKEQFENSFSSNQQSRKRKREEKEEDEEGETNKHRRR